MSDPPSPQPQETPEETADELGRSYDQFLGRQDEEAEQADESYQTEPQDTESKEVAPPPPVHRIIEALLFVGGAPLTAARAEEAVRGLTEEQFLQAVSDLNRDYRRQGRPYAIQVRDSGYALELRPRFRGAVEKLYGTHREARLSPAAIDVLALVAYRQPASRQEIENIRGVESSGVLRQLVRRGLITVVHRAEATHREVSYGTTPRFLDLFGLRSLDDLPQTQDLQKL
jgi:segregation and condensation protein B